VKEDLNFKKMAEQAMNRVKAVDVELKDKLVSVNRVTKVTKGGRTFSFSAIIVVGDENGIVGHGLAKKNLIKVPILRGTVPHTQKGKFGGAQVLLKPATPGTGVIAGGAMRAVLESVGIHNVLAKSQGSSNPHNVVKATIDALSKMRDAIAVAKQRGISMDKVFNG
jgi:small subunit ribosomal protein S5